MKEGIRVSPELLRQRRLGLLKAALTRLMHEEAGPATQDISEFNRQDGAEVIQLENPKGGERWEIIMSLGGMLVFLRQLFYSGAGNTWQVGKEFRFHADELIGTVVVEVPQNDEIFLANGPYYGGVKEAIGAWPVAKWYVAPLEDKV